MRREITATERPGEILPESFTPSEFDICSGRGKKHWNAPGNRAFRSLLRSHTPEYQATTSKHSKTVLIHTIVSDLRKKGVRFLKEKNSRWYDMGDAQARDKIGHGLRDQVAANRRAKTKLPPPTVEEHQLQKKTVIPTKQVTKATNTTMLAQEHQADNNSHVNSAKAQGTVVSAVPQPFDVICALPRDTSSLRGNAVFHALLEAQAMIHWEIQKESHMQQLTQGILSHMRGAGCRFLKQDNDGTWLDMSNVEAGEKVRQGIRDHCMAEQRRERKKAAIARLLQKGHCEQHGRAIIPVPASHTGTTVHDCSLQRDWKWNTLQHAVNMAAKNIHFTR